MQASEEEWRQYIDDRAAKGFSVVQIAPAASWFTSSDRAGTTPFLGGGIIQWNPAYWQGFERKVEYANQRGLAVALIGVQDPIDDTWPGAVDAARFARSIVARPYGNHVVFSPSFDKPYSELSNTTGAAIREATSLHLITQHPGTPSGEPANIWSEQYFDQAYLDIAGVQTGHNGGDRTLTTHQAIDWNMSLSHRSPPKPVINLEAYYDANGSFPDGPGSYQGTAHDARSLGYLSLLSGASGYTYGARGLMIWQNNPEAREYWRTALGYPSSSQMTILRDLFSSIAWWSLEPAHAAIRDQPGDQTRQMDATLIISIPDECGIKELMQVLLAQAEACSIVFTPEAQPIIQSFPPRPSHSDLTETEWQIIVLGVQGVARNRIADQLCLAPSTISTYWARIYSKLGIRNRVGLMAWYQNHATTPAPAIAEGELGATRTVGE